MVNFSIPGEERWEQLLELAKYTQTKNLQFWKLDKQKKQEDSYSQQHISFKYSIEQPNLSRIPII